ncbi:MAG: hypothetical protein ACI81V_001346 [Lentimonas sp.]|jgi:hypothetical protein
MTAKEQAPPPTASGNANLRGGVKLKLRLLECFSPTTDTLLRHTAPTQCSDAVLARGDAESIRIGALQAKSAGLPYVTSYRLRAPAAALREN